MADHSASSAQQVPAEKPLVAITGGRGLPPSWGGVERQWEALYTRLAGRGWNVLVYARATYVPPDTVTHKGVAVKVLPTVRSTFLEALAHTFLAVVHMAFVSRPAIVHIYSQGPCLMLPLVKLLMPRAKVFFTCGGVDWQRRKWPVLAAWIIRLGEFFSARLTDCRIMVSRELVGHYRERYGVESVCIPNGVDIPPQPSPEPLAAMGLEAGRYFLSVGRITPEKRVEDIIAAFRKSPRHVQLAVVGDDAAGNGYMDRLRALAAGDERIVFTGYRFSEDLAALFGYAIAFITASELEGMPLTLLEAMAYGRACLASSIAPHHEVLGDNAPGMFPTHDEAALATLMDQAEAAGMDGMHGYGQACRTRVAEQFGWDLAVQQLEMLYAQALAGRPCHLGESTS